MRNARTFSLLSVLRLLITVSLMRYAALVCLAVCTESAPTHILHIIGDDLGWAEVSWHRNDVSPTSEVQTPRMQALRDQGLELDRFCKRRPSPPTLLYYSSTQSGAISPLFFPPTLLRYSATESLRSHHTPRTPPLQPAQNLQTRTKSARQAAVHCNQGERLSMSTCRTSSPRYATQRIRWVATRASPRT